MIGYDFTHTIIIGGTGMLRLAAVALAARSQRLTSVAHTRRSLARLNAALAHTHCVHHMVALDWTLPERFIAEIERHMAATEPPDLVVAWIHDDQLGLRLFRVLAQVGYPMRYFQLIGSSTRNPQHIADGLLLELTDHAASYHQILLGVHGSGSQARWLTHQEISTGVLAAVERAQVRFVLGDLDGFGRISWAP